MTGRDLTVKQNTVYQFIRQYITRHQHAPYIREIQEACGISAYKAAVDKLLALEKKGYIARKLNKHRSIQILMDHEAPLQEVL